MRGGTIAAVVTAHRRRRGRPDRVTPGVLSMLALLVACEGAPVLKDAVDGGVDAATGETDVSAAMGAMPSGGAGVPSEKLPADSDADAACQVTSGRDAACCDDDDCRSAETCKRDGSTSGPGVCVAMTAAPQGEPDAGGEGEQTQPPPVCGGADLKTDPDNCGVCGLACAEGESCVDGECALVCDADLASDPGHCGACGRACGGGQVCTQGECREPSVTGITCEVGRKACGVDCIDDAACCDDSDCRAMTASTPYCIRDEGTCVACLTGGHCRSDELCEAGACVPRPEPCDGQCNPYESCVDDRCECPGNPDLQSDTDHCGECGRRCAIGQECAAGRCQAFCGGASILTDENNCGEDCRVCAVNEECVLGQCLSCGNVETDESNCGECGHRCDRDEACVSGECQATARCGDGVLDLSLGEQCDPGRNVTGCTDCLITGGYGDLCDNPGDTSVDGFCYSFGLGQAGGASPPMVMPPCLADQSCPAVPGADWATFCSGQGGICFLGCDTAADCPPGYTCWGALHCWKL